jgi:glutaredoxin
MNNASTVNLPALRSLALVLLAVWGVSQGVSWWQDQRSAEAVRLGSQRHALVVYSTDTCAYCARARAWLDTHGARWQECNVERDADCASTYEAQGAPGVPLVRVSPMNAPEKALWNLGFSPAWVASAMSKLDAHRPSAASSPRP